MTNSLCVLGLMACLVVLAIAESRNSYCNLPSCHGHSHTLCKYPPLQTSEKCGKVTSSKLTKDEIKELLTAHKPRHLTWDKELADIAQTWADQCKPSLDECRNVERFLVGQSYKYVKTTQPFKVKLSEMLNLSQLTKETTHIGCGAVRYNPDGKFNTTYLICNYGSSVQWTDIKNI